MKKKASKSKKIALVDRLKSRSFVKLMDDIDLSVYRVKRVYDKPYYGKIIYGKTIEINCEQAIPVYRRLISLIHESLHHLNPGWTHIKLHHLAVAIFMEPDATSDELSLMTKSHISAERLAKCLNFVARHYRIVLN